MGAEFGAAETGITLVHMICAQLALERDARNLGDKQANNMRIARLEEELEEQASRNRKRLKLIQGDKSCTMPSILKPSS